MKAAIRFIEPDNKPAILTKLLDIIQGIDQLRQHVVTHGILLENLTASEVKALKDALRELDYSDYTATENSLRLKIAGGDLSSLIRLVITIPGFENDFAEMFWERGFTIENLPPDQAEDLKRRLEPIAIVTITPDIADTPEPVVYTVSGQVRHRDNSPFTESGFTVHVFDSVSPNNLVELGSVALSPQASYHLSYAWRPDSRSGPNLVVRLVNPQEETVAEVRASLASAQAVLNITVKNPQPQSFVLTARVKNQATGEVLPNVQVEAQFRANSTTLRTISGTTSPEGVAPIPFDESVFKDGQNVAVIFGVHREGQALETNTIPNLQPKNQEVDILVSVPETNGERFIVSGTVRQADETPLPDVIVRAFDRDMRAEELLGEVVTNAQGFYEIRYSPELFRRKEKERADLLVRVLDKAGKEIAVSRTVFNAPAQQMIDLEVELEKYRGASEYDRYLREIKPLTEDVPIDELTDEDLRFLTGEMNIQYEHIDYLRLDMRWSSQYKLTSGVFYGFLRQGFPSSLRSLLAEKPSRLRSSLQASLDRNIIPVEIRTQIDQIIEQLILLGTSLAFEPEKDAKEPAPVGAILKTAQLEPEVAHKVVEFIFRHEGEDDLWKALASNVDIGQPALNTVRFTLESSTIVLNHLPTLEAVQTFRKEQSWNTARDLARLKRSDWKQIAQKTTAQALPDGFENADQFAEAIAYGIEQIFPTAVVAHRLAEDPKLSNNDINYFFAANSDFDLLHTPLEGYLKNGANLGQVNDRVGLTTKLKTFQRVARVTPDKNRFDIMQHLLHEGYDSAIKIVESDEKEYYEYIMPIAGLAAAKDIRLNAKARVDTANIFVPGILDYYTGIAALPGAARTGELPTWAKLFGSLSSCACKHCRSVYSPAAYLVDLLQFLRKAPGIGSQLLTELLKRRPDLEQILLNCDNANTPLPYIDLVNEILELQVSRPSPLPFYQTVGSSDLEKAKLRAYPQNRHDPAYAVLSGAFYPWTLPFNLAREETKLFSQIADIKLFEVFELFSQGPERIAQAHLGMTNETWNMIVTPVSSDEALVPFWGNPSGGLVTLDKVPEILARATLNYAELESLIHSRLFANSRLTSRSSYKLRINRSADPCKFEHHVLQKYKSAGEEYLPLDPRERSAVFDLIHRFVRLQRTLGWSTERLSEVLVERGFAPTLTSIVSLRIDLVDLSKLVRLADRLGVSVENAVKFKDASRLARALGRREVEIRYLIELSGIDPFQAGPARPFDLAKLEALLTHYDVLGKTGLDIAELRYLLLNKDLTPAVFEPTTAAVQVWLQNLYDAMRRSDAEFPVAGFNLVTDAVQMAVDYSVKLYDELLTKLADEPRKTGVEEFKQDITVNLQNELEAARAKIESEYGVHIAVETAVREFESIVKASYEAAAAANRELDNPLPIDVLQTTVKSFEEQFRPSFAASHDKWQNVTRAATENLAAAVGTNIEHLNLLVLPKWNEDGSIEQNSILHALSSEGPTAAAVPAIENFLALIRWRNEQPLPPLVFEGLPDSDAKKVSAEWMLIRMAKAARLIQLLNIAPEELKIIDKRRDTAYFLDFNTLPVPADLSSASFTELLTVARAKLIQSELPKADKTLFDFLEIAHSADITIDSLLSNIASQTGWNSDPRTGEEFSTSPKPLNALQAAFGLTIEEYRLPETYALLKAAVDLTKKKQIPAEALSIWLSGSAENGSDLRNSVERIARARYSSDEDWYKILTPLQDNLRERKRDALVSYLVNRSDSIWKEANSLYAYFLIDVEMSSCQLTSRIVQANSAIQLFVQRCLMNLEPAIQLGQTSESTYLQQWTWMKNYRVWEANRKVFLYPENWIEPDLRDDKSSFFIELENELLQDEITQESVERAYANYFEKLDDVARLQVQAICEEEHGQGLKTLHVVARTPSQPYIYFYRKRFSDQTWSSWENVDLGIESEHIFLVLHNGRLMLLWAIFSEFQDGLDLSLKWSSYRSGVWQAPRKETGSRLARLHLPFELERGKDFSRVVLKPEDFSFRVENNPTTNNLTVFLILLKRPVPWLPGVFAGSFNISGALPFSLAAFTFSSCKQELNIESRVESLRTPLLTNPVFISQRAMGYIADNDGPTALQVGINPRGVAEIPIPNRRWWNDRDLDIYEYVNAQSLMEANVSPSAYYWRNYLTLLKNFGDRYELMGHANDISFNVHRPFVINGSDRSYLVSEKLDSLQSENIYKKRVPEASSKEKMRQQHERKYKFESFYHPFLCEMVKKFNKNGIDGLLGVSSVGAILHRQIYKEPKSVQCVPWGPALTTKFHCYEPSAHVWKNSDDSYDPYPYEHFDFSQDGSYSVYNWEIFFHIPLLIADRLRKNQRFEDAQHWFHYIFNPTDVSVYAAPAKYWQVKPLFELAQQWAGPAETLEDMLRRLAVDNAELEYQVEQWRNNPFNPHLIARLRLVAYMKTVVQKYLDNLVAWGDHLFQQDTMESINEAAQLYILAAEILGPRPITISREETEARSYSTVKDNLDEFSNLLIEIDSSLPPQVFPLPESTLKEIPPNLILYFCLPSNEKLASYWDTVADRLFKVRHCMNIEGQVRQLPLFAPPIDPGLLVRARAMGLDLRSVVEGSLDIRQPYYRYQYLSQKAQEICNEVRSLGGALLGALEKKDAEELSLIRSRHELSMLKLVKIVKDKQIEEAKENLEGLRASRKLAEKRLEFYSSRELSSVRFI